MAHPKRFETPFEVYDTVREIGQGGAGYVLEVSSHKAALALKYLKPASVTDDRRRRFKNEMGFCRSMQHPNVVKVLDVGITVVGGVTCPFFVMPLYQSTLRAMVGKADRSRILPVFSKILDGVEAAHLSGVCHRDLKPENILLSADHGEVIVSDFGIAHFAEDLLATNVRTHKAARLANIAYSAPEQRVPGGAVDHRADIYALGLILNELFTGLIPHGTAYRLIAEVAPSNSYLDGLVEVMVRQDPNKRPASIGEIKRSLIARENDFISRQHIDELSRTVVPTTEVLDDLIVDPPHLVGADYRKGKMILQFNKPITAAWAAAFRSPSVAYEYIRGKPPAAYTFDGTDLQIPAQEEEIERLIVFTKKYVEMANRKYKTDTIAATREREEAERKRMRDELAKEEQRQRILDKIRNQLGP